MISLEQIQEDLELNRPDLKSSERTKIAKRLYVPIRRDRQLVSSKTHDPNNIRPRSRIKITPQLVRQVDLRIRNNYEASESHLIRMLHQVVGDKVHSRIHTSGTNGPNKLVYLMVNGVRIPAGEETYTIFRA